MKLADGGFGPAYNTQIVSAPKGQVIVAVDIDTTGSDRGLARPALERLAAARTTPSDYLVDGGFTKNDDIEWVRPSWAIRRLADPDSKAQQGSSRSLICATCSPQGRLLWRSPHLSARGDSFINVGDIAAIRFVLRAGPAALRLGTTGNAELAGNSGIFARMDLRNAVGAERPKALDQQRVVEPRQARILVDVHPGDPPITPVSVATHNLTGLLQNEQPS